MATSLSVINHEHRDGWTYESDTTDSFDSKSDKIEEADIRYPCRHSGVFPKVTAKLLEDFVLEMSDDDKLYNNEFCMLKRDGAFVIPRGSAIRSVRAVPGKEGTCVIHVFATVAKPTMQQESLASYLRKIFEKKQSIAKDRPTLQYKNQYQRLLNAFSKAMAEMTAKDKSVLLRARAYLVNPQPKGQTAVKPEKPVTLRRRKSRFFLVQKLSEDGRRMLVKQNPEAVKQWMSSRYFYAEELREILKILDDLIDDYKKQALTVDPDFEISKASLNRKFDDPTEEKAVKMAKFFFQLKSLVKDQRRDQARKLFDSKDREFKLKETFRKSDSMALYFRIPKNDGFDVKRQLDKKFKF